MKFGLNSILTRLFSTSAAGLYIILFAASIGVATFIENDFGTSAAQKLIFKASWFELLLALFAISLIFNIFRFRMIQQKKWAILTFHLAMVIIILGAAMTRYMGYEGMMHIREGDVSNTYLSREGYLQFDAQKGDQRYVFDEPILFSSLGNNSFKKSYRLDEDLLNVEVVDFLPNPTESMVDDEAGLPTVKVVMGGANGREEYYIQEGSRKNIRGTIFNFSEGIIPDGVNLKLQNDSLLFQASKAYDVTVMATQEKLQMEPGEWHPLNLRSLYASANSSFVFGLYSPHAKVDIISESTKMSSSSLGGVKLKLSTGNNEQEILVIGGEGIEGMPRTASLGDLSVNVAYGSKMKVLPFSIKLNDFIMEKYPGTNSASSYASEVTLIDDKENEHMDYRIFMNNILNYKGYRFFQSSFDQDELGTYLSVNNDAPGTFLTYLGYALLTLGMLLMFFDKKSRFQHLNRNITKIRQSRKIVTSVIALVIFSFSVSTVSADSPPMEPSVKVINIEHANYFGRLILQDFRGRFKAMNIHCSEIVRKLYKKESWFGMNPDQIVLSMVTYPEDWYHVPIIKLGHHEEISKIIGVSGDYCSYSDLFDENGQYKLTQYIRQAYNTPQSDRGVFEKELLKLDEKVNICSMVFSGDFMRVFPLENDENHTWVSPSKLTESSGGNGILVKYFPAYIGSIQESLTSGNWELPNKLITELRGYQKRIAGDVLPSEGKLNAEILLNKLNIFSRLTGVYAILGLLFVGLLFTSVFKPNIQLKWPVRIALGLFFTAFLFHLFGLGMRWYISGRAPWSNGYESMIYIAFTTTLAGLIFSRKSLGGLAATNILAATGLMVASLSFLDPEITPLVPVLKSYWLTIHVSLEAGSYGFLMLGALIGVLNLIFMILANKNNGEKVYKMIREMSYISEMTLIAGLVMVSIGTYLGGVWANESWGRYWGWDPKETWALVTILVYAFILHMRFIPGFRGLYAFNVSTLFGWATVIMTYFGVNYYLSGLHSYAAGDPMPVPPAIKVSVIVLTIISLLAMWRYRAIKKAGIKV